MHLEQRLARLERANRRMKRIGALVLMVAGAALLSGQANGKDLQHLEVGSLTLKDKDGKTRAALGVNADGWATLTLFDTDGRVRSMLSEESLALLDKDRTVRSMLIEGSLTLFEKDGDPRVRLTANDRPPGLTLYGKDGKTWASLHGGPNGSQLTLYDKNQKPRATLGVTTTVNKRTGAETKTSAGTLTLYDAKGSVLW